MNKDREKKENTLATLIGISLFLGIGSLIGLAIGCGVDDFPDTLFNALIIVGVGSMLVCLIANIPYQRMCKEDSAKERQDAMRRMMSYDPIGTRDMVMNSAGLSTPTSPIKESPKKASVVGRAVVGGIIGGETGAVIGAMSAMNENNNKK